MDFTPDGTQVWVTNPNSNQTTVFDARARELIASLTLAKSPSGVYMSSDGRHAYITNAVANELTFIDVASRKILGTMPIGTDPDGVAWSER
jgi:YVTN family beta-propeller protein